MKVSVLVFTFNHEDFVRDALNGVVAQEVDFPFEVIVADDASTDATPDIIRDFAARYPNLIKPLLRPKNLGVIENSKDAYCRAIGKYITTCDGDDYWSDASKLKKQVSVLDGRPDVALCFHPVHVTWTDAREPDSTYPPVEWWGDLSLNALLTRNFIGPGSAMFRNQGWYESIPTDIMPSDHYLYVRHALEGHIAMLPEVMAVYRRHPSAMWVPFTDKPRFYRLADTAAGQAACYEALLKLFPEPGIHRQTLLELADIVLRDMAYALGDDGLDILLKTISDHPLFAAMALAHLWNKEDLQ